MSDKINDNGDKTQVFLRGNGEVVFISPIKGSDSTLQSTAVLLRDNGKRGKTLHDDTEALADRQCEAVASVLEDWALFALGLIEAAHRGDHTVFRNIHRALTKKEKPMDVIKNILAKEARESKRMPTAHEIAAQAVKLDKSGDELTNPRNIKNNLAKDGITVKSRKKGRPKKP